jgi:2-dehydropantoate 2-reductase
MAGGVTGGLRHAVLGAGGVGLALAADLAGSGAGVTLVMREPSLAAYGGLVRVRRTGRADTTTPVPAVDVLTDPVDVLWIATKAHQLGAALRAVRPDGVARATVVPLLNGVEHLAGLRAVFAGRVAGGAIRVEARREEVGVVVRESLFLEIELGMPRDRVPAGLAADLERAGIGVRLAEDGAGVLWRKLVFLAPLALATAAAGGPLGTVRRDPVVAGLMTACAREACAVAATTGVRVDAHRTARLLSSLPGRTTSSLERDVRGGDLGELDAIGGAVLRAGAVAGIPTPATRTLVDRVRRAGREG